MDAGAVGFSITYACELLPRQSMGWTDWQCRSLSLSFGL